MVKWGKDKNNRYRILDSIKPRITKIMRVEDWNVPSITRQMTTVVPHLGRLIEIRN
jgi:hypothetical protein